MRTIIVIIKLNDETNTYRVSSDKFSLFMNNYKLYIMDKDFLVSSISKFEKTKLVPIGSKYLDFVIIDFDDCQIYDNQCQVGIFKFAPVDVILPSYNKLFKQAIDEKRLIGYEEWVDSGTKIDKSISGYSFDDIIKFNDSNDQFGQYIFDVSPFTLKVFLNKDYESQKFFYELLKTKYNLNTEYYSKWEYRLNLLKG